MPIDTQRQSITPVTAKRYLWLSPLAGLLLALAFPNDRLPGTWGDHPSSLIAWVALIPLLLGILACSPRHARWGTWLFSFAFYLGTLTWMRLFGYLPWILLAAYLALTPWAALLLTQRMRLPRWGTPLGFALAWSGLEWLRGQGMLGFLWSELGASQIEGITARIASVGGIPLITFLMLWVVGSLLLQALHRNTPRWVLPAALLALLLCLGGGWRQSQNAVHRWRKQPASQLIAVVQPNTLRGLTPDALVQETPPEVRRQRLQTLIDLSSRAMLSTSQSADTARLIIWPESAIAEPPYDPDIARLCQRTGSYLLLGAPRLEYVANKVQLFNSACLIDPNAIWRGQYDKIHLVPFGEFVPFRSLVARYYTVRESDIQPGKRHTTLTANGHAFGVGICFESTVADIARAYACRQAGLLIFITNDAWFHQTPAVRQHFNHARFRALETGLPVARAASTGISGFIAPDGRILREIPTYTQGTLTLAMPDGKPGTIYTRVGWLFGPLCLVISIVLTVLGLLHKRTSSPVNETLC